MHVEPPPTPPSKTATLEIQQRDRLNKGKNLGDPGLVTSKTYKTKMAIFNNVQPDEFLLFIKDFRRTLEDTGAILTSGHIHYLCSLIHREALHKLYYIDNYHRDTTATNVEAIMQGLGMYFSAKMISKQIT